MGLFRGGAQEYGFFLFFNYPNDSKNYDVQRAIDSANPSAVSGHEFTFYF